MKAHWDTLFSVDFTTIKVWTTGGLVTFYIMAVMHLKTRRVETAGITRRVSTLLGCDKSAAI